MKNLLNSLKIKAHINKLLNSSILKRLFINSIVVLIIPIILFGSIFYFNILKAFKDEINLSNLSHLNSIKENTDGILDELKGKSIFIASSDYVESFYTAKYIKKLRGINYVEAAINLMTFLRANSDANSYIHSMYIYNDITNDVLTSKQQLEKLDNFYDTHWHDMYEQNRDFIQLMPQHRPIDDDYFDKHKRLDPEWYHANEKVVTFIYPFKLYPNTILNGALMINVYEDALSFAKNITDTENDSNIIIAKSNGIVISSQIDTPDYDLNKIVTSIVKQDKLSGYISSKHGDTQYLITYVYSDDHDLVYIKTTDINKLYKKLNFYRLLIVFVSILLTLGGTLYSYNQAMKVYNPIESTLKTLNIQLSNIPKEKRNEIKILSNAISKMIKESNKLSNIFESQKESIKQSYVQEIIRGNTTHYQNLFGNEMSHFTCMVLSIDKYKEFTEKYDYTEQNSLKRLILEIAEKTTSQYTPCSGSIMQRDRVVIVVASNLKENKSFEQMIDKITDAIKEQIALLNQFSISIGIGSTYKQAHMIRNSYLESVETLKYRILKGHSSIIHYKDLNDYYKGYYSATNIDKKIINNLKINNYKAIEILISDLVSELKSKNNISYENIIQIFYGLVSSMLEYLEISHIIITEIQDDDVNISESLVHSETLEEIEILILSFIKKIIIHQKSNTLSEENYAKQAIDYIHKNFTNPNFDVAALVDDLSIPYQQLRRIIIEQTGMNCNKYINFLRIEKAKELLYTSSISIKNIASNIGYNNDQSLNRHFKKQEGITPGEFRRLHQ
ncbi:helix-turn-helix domain-containing protein [Wukongibacter baidiensis]|uniref:helix-turn-helix domain-containing protein n=1 Tax=Wukongibacter baidiensis TaxID=1723361 RepID=UPI003D7FD652